jgi:DNA-binding transcriptional LysR family regulator
MLLRHAADIGARVSLAEAELLQLAHERRGEVRIRLAVIGSLAASLTPILVAALARQMPEVVPRITEAGTHDSRDLLERGEADFAVHLTANDGRDALLATEQLFFITLGAGNANAAPIALADVVRERLILPAQGNPLRSFIERAVSRAGFHLDVALEIDGVEPRRRAVLAGLGSTILGGYSLAAGDARAELAARPIVAPELFRPMYLGGRRGLDPDLVARISSVLTQSLKDFDISVARRTLADTQD